MQNVLNALYPFIIGTMNYMTPTTSMLSYRRKICLHIFFNKHKRFVRETSIGCQIDPAQAPSVCLPPVGWTFPVGSQARVAQSFHQLQQPHVVELDGAQWSESVLVWDLRRSGAQLLEILRLKIFSLNLGFFKDKRNAWQVTLSSFKWRVKGIWSQRSLHSAPVFRLLLKVAVNGTHHCDFHNFFHPVVTYRYIYIFWNFAYTPQALALLHTWATKKKRPYFPLNPGCFRGILITVIPRVPQTTSFFSLLNSPLQLSPFKPCGDVRSSQAFAVFVEIDVLHLQMPHRSSHHGWKFLFLPDVPAGRYKKHHFEVPKPVMYIWNQPRKGHEHCKPWNVPWRFRKFRMNGFSVDDLG